MFQPIPKTGLFLSFLVSLFFLFSFPFAGSSFAQTSAKRLPATTFSYGADCGVYKGGCPLASYSWEITPQGAQAAKTANDFFLQSVDNGYNGTVGFEYWIDDYKVNNALNIKYCDPAGGVCRTDNKYNTQRHRVSRVIIGDGMGNKYYTKYDYPTNEPLAYVKNFAGPIDDCPCNDASINTKWCDNSLLTQDEICDSPYCGLQNDSNTCCGPEYKQYKCVGQAFCGASNKYCVCGCHDEWRDFSGYEFLGYPEVTTIAYEKNSTTDIASQTKTLFYQALNNTGCFKPSPLTGIAYKALVYNADDLSKYNESETKFTVRFGPMFSSYTEKTDTDLNSYCANYDPGITVSAILQTGSISKGIMPNASLCTRSEVIYNTDAYALPKKTINYGKVSCTNTSQDDTSDTSKMSFTNYTTANTTSWILPMTSETWTGDSDTGAKYNHSRIFYDSYAQIIKTQSLSDGNVYAESTVGHDTTYPWLTVKTTDPLGRITTMAYDPTFHMYPVSVTNTLGQTSYIYYDFNNPDLTHPNYGGVSGVVTKITDINSASTTSVYDSFGRVKEVYLPGKTPQTGVKASSFSKYFYFNENEITPCDEENNCLTGLGKNTTPKMMVYKGTRLSDDGGAGKISGTHTFYNGIGQEIQTRGVWYEGEYANAGTPMDEGLKDIIYSKSYNSLGNTQYVSDGYTATPHTQISTTSYDVRDYIISSVINKISHTYDGFGRTKVTLYPDGSKEETVYEVDGNPLKIKSLDKNCTDANAGTPCSEKVSTSDAFGQTLETKITDTSNSKVYKTTSKYHPVLGAVTEIYDTQGTLVNKIEYDKLGRKTKMWNIDMSPAMSNDGNAWRYEYDLLGNLTKQTNPKGQISELAYDNLNRLLTSKVNGKMLSENVYDNCTYGKGKICQSKSYNPQGGSLLKTEGYKYNLRGGLVEQTTTLSNMPDAQVNGKIFTTGIAYDEGGRIISSKLNGVTLSTGVSIPAETLTTNFNRSQITGISTNAAIGNYLKDSVYNKNGQLVAATMGNNVVSSLTYNPNNKRLAAMSLTGTNIGNQNKINLTYGYDPAGNITNISDLNNLRTPSFSLNQQFTYDALYRLKGVSGGYSAGYQYDDLGNILSRSEGGNNAILSYGISTSGYYHRPQSSLIASSSATLAYDAVGNMTRDYMNFYEYDENNRLIKVRVPQLTPAITPTNTPKPTNTPTPAISLTPTITPTPTPYRLPCDANKDDVVNESDYSIWLVNYNTTKNGPDYGDFNSDNYVDGIDYALWRKNFGMSLTPTVTPPGTTILPTPSPVSINPSEDAYVTASSPTVNYGSATTLMVDNSPINITYMKFNLASLAGKSISSAKLRFKVTSPSVNTQNIKTAPNTWAEGTITYNNKPAPATLITTIPAITAAGAAEVDLTSYIRSNLGTAISIEIDANGTDGLDFYSKESTALNKPYLYIQ